MAIETGEKPGADIDAQPRGLIFDIKRYAVHDGPGVRTVVFLKGCSLSCIWCHNPESISSRPELLLQPQRCIGCGVCVLVCPVHAHHLAPSGEHLILRERCQLCGQCVEECYAEALVIAGRTYTLDETMKVVLEDRAFYEFSGGGVTLSGGEPLVQPAFSIALLGRCREAGIHTALDTSGHISWEVMEQALPFVDIMLYDLKHMNARDHRRLCGAENEITLANLQRLCQTGIPVEIRIPVVPSITDNPAMLRAAGSFLASLDNIVAVRLLPYHRLAGSKYHGIGRANTLPEVETPGRKQMEDVAACLQAEHILPIVISV